MRYREPLMHNDPRHIPYAWRYANEPTIQREHWIARKGIMGREHWR